MIIVLEGPDNAGKTTLGMRLAKDLRAVYVKVERPRRAVDLVAYQQILEHANDYSGWVVSDRHVAISEPIYGPICRGGHELREGDLLMAYGRLQAVIYCRPSVARILGTLADRQQMAGVVENGEAIVKAYDEWFLRMIEERDRGNKRMLYSYNFETYQDYHHEALLRALRDHAQSLI